MSVDPYMRGRMNDAKSYVPPYELGKAMYGGAVGEVVAGGTAGSLVVHQLGWREAALVDPDRAQPGDVPDGVSPSALLGALGMPGMTAWVGLTEIAPVEAGETVFISAAAGAVGSVAGQIAKARGCRVIGSAGAPEKVAYVRDELGFDAAFSHRDDVRAALKEAAPDGVDVYFDNVGGPQLEAAIGRLNRGGRIALCGAVSQYNATEPAPGPRNLALMVGKRGRMRGFIVERPLRALRRVPRRGRGAVRRGRAEDAGDDRRGRHRGGAGRVRRHAPRRASRQGRRPALGERHEAPAVARGPPRRGHPERAVEDAGRQREQRDAGREHEQLLAAGEQARADDHGRRAGRRVGGAQQPQQAAGAADGEGDGGRALEREPVLERARRVGEPEHEQPEEGDRRSDAGGR